MTMLHHGATWCYTGSMTETGYQGAAMSWVGSTVDTTEGSGTITLFEKGYPGEDSIFWVQLDGESFSLPYEAAFTGTLVRVGVASVGAIREACA